VGWPSGLRRWFAKPLRANTPRAGSNPVPTAMPAEEVHINDEKGDTTPQGAGIPATEGTKKKLIEEKDIYSWKAPSRPFKRRNREYFITIIAMAAIVALVLFFAEGFMPVLLIVALVFLYYTLNTVEPEEIIFSITNTGVRIADRKIEWEIVKKYWFSKKMDTQVLVLGLGIIPGRMDLVINPGDEERIRKAMKGHAPEEETPPSQIDKTIDWVSGKLPGS
jgi:hypothetical protein